MMHQMNCYLRLFVTVFVLVMSSKASQAEVEPADFKGEDKERYERYLELKESSIPEEFYSYAKDYEDFLKSKGYMNIYYKLKNNEGFYALRHNMILRAMQAARELDDEIRKNNATQYIYLATGLMGDIYSMTQNRMKAEEYFTQALKQVGDADPKFTMRTYQNLTELLCVKAPGKALEYGKESLLLARKTANVEYQALALAMMAYVYFLNGNHEGFFDYYDQYISLRSMENPQFSHRYDKMMEIARLAMNREYVRVEQKLREGGVRVDSSLMGIRIVTLESGDSKSFIAVKNRFLEMDSVNALIRDTNLDRMAYEQNQMVSDEAHMTSKHLWVVLIVSLLLMFGVFYFLFKWMHRRLIQHKQRSAASLEADPDWERKSMQVNAFCRGLLSAVKKQEGRDVEMRFSTQVDNDFAIVTQPDLLRQLLTFQLHKTIKQTGRGYVMLQCEKQDGQLTLTVKSSEPSYVYTISCAC